LKPRDLLLGGRFSGGVVGFGCFADAGDLLAGPQVFASAGESYFVIECVDYEGVAGDARHKFEADPAVVGLALISIDADFFAMELSGRIAKSDNEIPAFGGHTVCWLPGERAMASVLSAALLIRRSQIADAGRVLLMVIL
jgi:hypothetical protein